MSSDSFDSTDYVVTLFRSWYFCDILQSCDGVGVGEVLAMQGAAGV